MHTEQLMETDPLSPPPDGYYIYKVWHDGAECYHKIGAPTSQVAVETYAKRVSLNVVCNVYAQYNGSTVTFEVTPIPTFDYSLAMKD